jgi:hypothetical protein
MLSLLGWVSEIHALNRCMELSDNLESIVGTSANVVLKGKHLGIVLSVPPFALCSF